MWVSMGVETGFNSSKLKRRRMHQQTGVQLCSSAEICIGSHRPEEHIERVLGFLDLYRSRISISFLCVLWLLYGRSTKHFIALCRTGYINRYYDNIIMHFYDNQSKTAYKASFIQN